MDEITDINLTRIGYTYANENGQKFYWHVDLPELQLRQDEDREWLLWSVSDHTEVLITKKEIASIRELKILHFILSGENL